MAKLSNSAIAELLVDSCLLLLTRAFGPLTLRPMTTSMIRGGLWAALVLCSAIACGPENSPPGNPEPKCTADSDCVASTTRCEYSACISGQCLLEPVAAGVSCDDGLFCTVGEACDGQGACSGGISPCNELIPGLPKCDEATRSCEICTDGRPLVNGVCRCPFWNCTGRGGAMYCSPTDKTEPNQVSCFFDGATASG